MKPASKSRHVVIGATALTAAFTAHQAVSLAQKAPESAPPKVAEWPLVVEPMTNDTEPVTIDGITFKSWADYFSSDYFAQNNKRCGFMPGPFADIPDEGGIAGGSTIDCAAANTNPGGAAIYSPSAIKFRIPMIVHNITNGATGSLTDAQIQANVVVINEDFLALAGTPGALGNNAQIEFVLTDDFATANGGGTTTGNGIMRYNNATWYNDGGAYYNTIARDPSNYFNLYTNSAGGGGTLGYTTSTQPLGGGGINTASDRVVILWSAVGDPCPVGGVYCAGRTFTHEIGHYLGLYHTWDFGCDSGSCSTTGDRVCDTNQISSPTSNCPASKTTCTDGPDNFRNYMDYPPDTCYTNFTVNQINRMRCVLDNWRTNLPYRIPIFQGSFVATPNVLAANSTVSGTTVCDNDFSQPGMSDGAGDAVGAYAGSPSLKESGDEVAYRIDHAGGNLKVTLSGLSSDLDLFVLSAAGTPASTIARSTLSGTSDEEVNIAGAPAGTYYAVVETFAVSSHSVYGSNYNIRYSKCGADVNGSNTVDVADLLAVITGWGPCPSPCPPNCAADIVSNCNVDVADLLAVITAWGACP